MQGAGWFGMTSAAGEHPRPLSLAFARQIPPFAAYAASSPGRGRWHEVPEGEQGVTVSDGEGEPAEKENIFRLFPENATFLQKKLQFFLEKGRFPIDSLVIIGM